MNYNHKYISLFQAKLLDLSTEAFTILSNFLLRRDWRIIFYRLLMTRFRTRNGKSFHLLLVCLR